MAPVAAEAPAQSSLFLAGATPPATCPASSSILVNGSFLAAGSPPAVLLNGSPVLINSLALGEASSLGPLLLTGGGGAPPPQPSPQGTSEAKTSLVLDPQTGEVRLEETPPEAPETKGVQGAVPGAAGEEVPGTLPQVVPGPLPASTFSLAPGAVPSVAAAPQVVPLSPSSGYPTGLSPTSPLLNLPQVVPSSQVVTLPQAVGPLQLLAAGPGSPVKVAATAGPGNVHLINSGVGVTALQLPSATTPGTPPALLGWQVSCPGSGSWVKPFGTSVWPPASPLHPLSPQGTSSWPTLCLAAPLSLGSLCSRARSSSQPPFPPACSSPRSCLLPPA